MNKKQVLVEIAEIGARGDGIGLYQGHKVYAGKTAPGDLALVQLGKLKQDGYAARLLKLERPGPDRAPPPCPHYAQCGSCSLQHITQQFYREWKIARVQKALSRAHVEWQNWEEPVFLQAATRRRATLAACKINRTVRFGYNEARTHNILDIPTCPVLEPELDRTLSDLRKFLPRLLPDNKAVDLKLLHVDGVYDMVLIGPYRRRGKFTLEQDEALGEMAEKLDIARIAFREKDFAPLEIVLNRKPVRKRFGAISVELPPAAFLQASQAGEDALAGLVLRHTQGARRVLDLFCGCGTFSGHMLQAGAQVTAMDGDAAAIEALASSRHERLNAIRRDLFRNPVKDSELAGFDAVIFDPPRAGAREQAERLAGSGVPVIIGVSCNPGSFARDAAILQQGGYRLESVTLVDQFVYSAHVELVSRFVRR